VRVQKAANGSPVEGATVRWEVLGGDGAILDPTSTKTDTLGLAETQMRMGQALGPYLVRATLAGKEGASVEFSAEAILIPELSALPLDPVEIGDTILVQGANFSLIPGQNVVTFSGIRGKTVSSTGDGIQVEVPPCLLPRDYQVRVKVGALSSESLTLGLQGTPSSLDLSRGEDLFLDASEGLGCVHLPNDPQGFYLAVPFSTGTVGGGRHEYSLLALTGDNVSPAFPGTPSPSRSGGNQGGEGARGFSEGLARVQARSLDARDRWDEYLRIREGELWAEGGSAPPAPALKAPGSAGPSRLPVVGDERVFKVLNAQEKFDRVRAKLRFIMPHSLVYVDEKAPSGGFSEEDLAALALEFEEAIYPTVTSVFGSESDLDQNDRVIILLTPSVNRLTPSGSDGYVGGFFYGLDLLAGRDGSNEGEVFYALVPDPSGTEGHAISRFEALGVIPAVLAHEFEHMVHFNQRMLVGGAETTEALWLSEALAQMAEDLVGELFSLSYQTAKANQYRTGNWIRASRFLENPGQVSVLASKPPGTLAQRGAGWLLLKQVYGRTAPENLLAALVESKLSGVENITSAAGLEWWRIVGDWAGSLYLDGIGAPVRPDLLVDGVDLRLVLSSFGGNYPLEVGFLGSGSAAVSDTLWSSAPNYFIINPTDGDGMVISAGGSDGGAPEAGMGLRVLLVRLQ
jgi:hypothetical protein